MRRPALVLLVALFATLTAPALAQVVAPPGVPTHFRGDDVVHARLILDRSSVAAGESVQATVELIPDRGWHLYGPEHGDAGAPPTIAWTLPDSVHAGEISYPPSTRVTSRGLTTYEYHGRTPLRVALSVAADANRATPYALRADVRWLVCSNVCVPGHATLTGSLAVTPSMGNAIEAVLFALGLAFLGGVILNLMPCVFPVLSFKALRAIGEAPSARLRSAIAYAAGVTASCATLGGILLAVRSAGATIGWGFQLQSPPFVAFLAVLLLVLALVMSGAIEIAIPVPQRLARGVATAGAFGDGVLVTLIASACIAPYMGAALAYALSAATPVAIGVFIALGLGLSLPHVVLMTVPALLRRLPKPGAWMVTARRVLSVPLYLTVVWLVWVFVQQVAPVGSTAAAQQAVNGGTFTAARLTTLRQEHRPVFVIIGAAWCITCKVNERFALDRAEVTTHFRDRHVTVLRGDWTSQDPKITAYLHSLGAAGVPLYVYYAPGRAADVLPQILTPGIIINHLDRARAVASR
jgi:thiol:disulfide interchange protein